ncbi:pre-rRNA processing protein [Tilletia horrida]|nr:pre-rRNA processing protein [Tilletia horrida]
MAAMVALDSAFAKIRHHANSKIESQRKPAQLLLAIEATLDEQQEDKRKRLATERSPTEYLIALQSMLASAQEALVPTALYLLAIVAPHVQPATLLSQTGALLPPIANVLASSSSTDSESAAITLRSTLSILEAILLAAASTSSSSAFLKKNLVLSGCWNSAVALTLDVRPKIRKRAHDLVTAVLVASPNNHPYSDSTAQWAVSRLESIVASGGASISSAASKAQKKATDFAFDKKSGNAKNASAFAAARSQAVQQGDAAGSAGIWLCQLLKRIVKTFSSPSISAVAVILLRLPALQNPFLTAAAFEVFDALFRTTSLPSQTSADLAPISKDTLSRTLKTLLDPSVLPTESQSLSPALLSAYLRALGGALTSYSRYLVAGSSDSPPLQWAAVIPAIWGISVARALDSKTAGPASTKNPAVRQSAAETLIACVRFGLPDQEVESALAYVQSHGRQLAFAQPPGGPKADDRPFLVKVVAQIQDALGKHALRFANVVPELLDIVAALTRRLGHRTSLASSSSKKQASTRRQAASELLLPALIPVIAELRTSPAFPARENADAVLSAAIQVIGPRQILKQLPLGLLGENPDGQGRAWLLPLMRSSISNTELLHFVDELIPLSEKLFARKEEATSQADDQGSSLDPKQKQRLHVEAKMHEALVDQVWATFPAYCDLPHDLGVVLREKPEVISLLSSLLFSQPSLRPTVTRGLQRLVERNAALAKSAAPSADTKADFGLDQAEAQSNLDALAKLAYQDSLTAVGNGGLLANLMNVYSQAAADSRGFLLETIATFVEILPQEQADKLYTRILKMLKKGLASLEKEASNSSTTGAGANAPSPVAHTMLDLLGPLIPFLKTPDAKDLFAFLHQQDSDSKTQLLRSTDTGVQKRAYKLLTRLVELRGRDVLQPGVAAQLVETLNEVTPSVLTGSKRGRIALFAELIPRISATNELNLLPHIVPEAVLATKETNQQCREESYELLVEMGRKMAEAKAGAIQRRVAGGATAADEAMEDADTTADSTKSANLNEYLAMVSAGLAGTSPHMISATITALSRLVYEFHEDIAQNTLDELLSTLLVFLASANREIVKSSLGLVKVVIVTYPAEIVSKHLPQLVDLLLNGKTAQHKQHFKSKLRHIMERLMRKFGNQRIEELADEENRKLIVNIRKRKERAKRKKAGAAEDGDDVDMAAEGGSGAGVRAQKSHGMDAFEEALYGSDSDISSDDDDEEEGKGASGRSDKRGGAAEGSKRSQRKKQQDQTYILEDADEDDAMPLDLLDRSAFAARVATKNPSKAEQRKRQPGQEARKFNIEEGTGKMMIDDEDDDDAAVGGMSEHARLDAEAGAGSAFVAKQRGVDGFTVGKGGAVKFNKNNKRTREDEMELDAEAGGDQGADANGPTTTKAAAAIFAAAAAGDGQAGAAGGAKKKAKKEKVAIGAEFRAKKAGGDVSKNGQTPYAYVALGQVAGKKKGKGGEDGARLNITGKGKKGRA